MVNWTVNVDYKDPTNGTAFNIKRRPLKGFRKRTADAHRARKD